MPNVFTCGHCQKRITYDAQVVGDLLLHKDCVDPYRRAQRGLVHPCPQCDQRGRIEVETGHMVEKWVPAGAEGPLCGYDGCRGCYGCQNGLNRRQVKETRVETCPLCSGEGWLTKEPKPISKIVGWEKG